MLGDVSSELPIEKFALLISLFEEIGLYKIKLVGGEPTMSTDIFRFLEICFNSSCKNIGITTNGINTKALFNLAQTFSKLSFDVSIPSLCKKKFCHLTGGSELDHKNLLSTIELISSFQDRLTVNIVVHDKTYMLDNLYHDIDYLFGKTSRIKLILFCETEYNANSFTSTISKRSLEVFLCAIGAVRVGSMFNHTIYKYKDRYEISIVEPYCPIICKDSFKKTPTIRVTPDGFLKPCLLSNTGNINFLSLPKNLLHKRIMDIISNGPNCSNSFKYHDYNAAE